MPTLDVTPDPATTHWDRVSELTRRVTGAAGADHRVRFRALVCMVVVTVCLSVTPLPWAAVGLVALLVLALDWSRR